MSKDLYHENPLYDIRNHDYELFHYKNPYYRTSDFHSHDFYEVYFFLDGLVTYYVEEQVYDLVRGNVLIIPPGKMHRPVVQKRELVYDRFVLWLDTDYVSMLDDEKGNLLHMLHRMEHLGEYLLLLPPQELRFVSHLMDRLIRLRETGSAMSELCQSAYLTIVLSALYDQFEQSNFGEKNRPKADMIPRIIEYINTNLTKPMTLDDISNEFFISKYHLIRKFKQYTNATVYDYIIAKRIILAKKLIREGLSATAAAEQCGFSDYSNFYKAFTAKAGMTPGKFKSSGNPPGNG